MGSRRWRPSAPSPRPRALDVQMPGLDGFGVLAHLQPREIPVTVFVTAYDQHALRAFDVGAADYVLKPIVRARFDVAVARALERIGGSGKGAAGVPPVLRAHTQGPWIDRLVVEKRGRLVAVPRPRCAGSVRGELVRVTPRGRATSCAPPCACWSCGSIPCASCASIAGHVSLRPGRLHRAGCPRRRDRAPSGRDLPAMRAEAGAGAAGGASEVELDPGLSAFASGIRSPWREKRGRVMRIPHRLLLCDCLILPAVRGSSTGRSPWELGAERRDRDSPVRGRRRLRSGARRAVTLRAVRGHGSPTRWMSGRHSRFRYPSRHVLMPRVTESAGKGARHAEFSPLVLCAVSPWGRGPPAGAILRLGGRRGSPDISVETADAVHLDRWGTLRDGAVHGGSWTSISARRLPLGPTATDAFVVKYTKDLECTGP